MTLNTYSLYLKKSSKLIYSALNIIPWRHIWAVIRVEYHNKYDERIEMVEFTYKMKSCSH